MRRLLIVSLSSVALSSLSACSYLTPYKLDIPQGNAVTADQAAKLKLGMTRAQVRFAMGTPLLVDSFHRNRWDYIFYDSKGGKLEESKSFHVLFEGDRVVGLGGDTLPARVVAAQLAEPVDKAGDAKAADGKPAAAKP